MSKTNQFEAYVDYNPCEYVIRFDSSNLGLCEDPPISSLSEWLNIEKVRVYPGEVEIKLIVSAKMVNPANVLHGGLQCALLDEVIGMTGATLGYDHFLFAIDLKVDYLRPAKLGQEIHVKGKIIRKGKNIINCIGEIFTTDCKLIAQAKSNLII